MLLIIFLIITYIDNYKVIIGTNSSLFKYINHGLQTYDIKILEV